MIHLRRLKANNFKQLRDIDLAFARRGRFLVQGLNEAGKSTLFEAVYFALFGRSLSSETAHGKLDDLIHYGSDDAYVELALDLSGGRTMAIARRVRRGKQNVWELDLTGADGAVEEIRGNSVVNDRIEAELGLDSEALLNTCFVEQKKLDKLEGMNRTQREQSLMKLLNLDRLLQMESALRVKPADQANVDRLRDRTELARLQAEQPALDARLRTVAAALARLEAHALAVRAVAETGTVAEFTGKVVEAHATEASLAEQAAAAERFRQGLAHLQEGRALRDRALGAAAELERIGSALAAARTARDKELPAVMAHGQALRRLGKRVAWLAEVGEEQRSVVEAVRKADADLAALAEARAELNQVQQQLVAARGALRDAETDNTVVEGDLRAFDVREGLANWLAAHTAMTGPNGQTGQTGQNGQIGRNGPIGKSEPLTDVADVRRSLEVRRRQSGLQMGALAALVGACVLGALMTTAQARTALAAIAVLVLLVLTWRIRSHLGLTSDLATAIGRLEGEAAVRMREAGVLAAREASAAARLVELNTVRPATPDRARSAIAELDERLGSRTKSDVLGALQAIRDTIALSRAQIATLEPREAELRRTHGHRDGAALGQARDAQAARIERIGGILDRRRPKINAFADALDMDANYAVIEGELAGLRRELAGLRERAGAIPALEAQAAQQKLVTERHWSGAAEMWSKLPLGEIAAAQAVGPDAPDSARPWSTDLTDADWDGLAEALRGAYQAAGGDAVRRALEDATRQTAGLRERLAQAERTLLATLADLRRLAGSLTPPVRLPAAPAVPAASELADLTVALAPPSGVDRAALANEHERLRERLNVVRHEQARLARSLGLAGEVIDLAGAQAEFDAAAHALGVRQRAAGIVAQAGRNVVQGILPSTLSHMCHLLPALTQDRYMDAQLSDDYRIQVYDERAQAWKMKNIFSGGTRDQFSLALRLAFALATLPEERGTAPSFLFLDEPLGAFDIERAAALIRLLSEGDLATSFDQIFLISHVPVDADSFDHRIVLADGRVADSTLGNAEETDITANGSRSASE